MEPTLTHPSYYDIEKGCAKIAHNYLKLKGTPGFNELPGAILALSRGGLIPGVILSHIFGAPLIPVQYSSKRGKGDDKNHKNDLPILDKDITSILIVDDICDSGYTLKEVATHYTMSNVASHPKLFVNTAVLYYKKSAIYEPDLYWKKIASDSPWIIFPWE